MTQANTNSDGGDKISVIIVNYNGADLLGPCLKSLAEVRSPELEIIVVDNGSSDDTCELLESFPEVKLVRSDYNRGFAGGNNLGLAHCTYEYVLLLNNDTIVGPEFLRPLCDYLDQHPRVGIVQGKMTLPVHGDTLDVCGSFFTRLGLPYHFGFYKPDGPRYEGSFPVFGAKGACMLFRKELVERAGGFLFDERFYYEETDFCHRAWIAGSETHFVGAKPIEHLMGITSGKNKDPGFALRHYLRNMAFSLASNLGPAMRLRTMPLFYGTMLAGVVLSVITLRRAQAVAFWEALITPVARRDAIRQRRALVSSFRKSEDAAIFKTVTRNPRWSYFVKTFTGKLAEYQDE